MKQRHSSFALKFGGSMIMLLMSSSTNALSLSDTPLFLSGSVQPLVMLNISKDQQLYKKAYNDYSDLDGDGQLETTYSHSIDYYGYFDPKKCYTYNSGNSRFEPASISDTKYCNGQWSGNFLNWATMTRMDAVRKLLYGGLRSTDSSTLTVLERSYLPTDAHSFAKYYNGSDISQLTPFTVPSTATAINSNNSNNTAGIGTGRRIYRVGSNTSQFALGDQVIIRDAGNPDNYMIGAVGCVKGTGMNMYNGIATNSNSCSNSDNEIAVTVEKTFGTSGGTNRNWDIYNQTRLGITICNTTLNSGSNVSQTNTNPPLMRVASGNFALWSANERWQCLWREDSSNPGESTGSISNATRSNGNRAALSGLYASSIGPNKTTTSNGRIANGLGSGDYYVRVKVCDSGLLGTEKCKLYPGPDGVAGTADDSYKPIGLLQVYGDTNQMHFGLITGSYRNNISGGVVRKNVSSLVDEINTTTDGTFTSVAGIIKTLDRMRIIGYYYGDGTYNANWPNGDSCSWQLTNITENNCTSWGNPMSEIYYESLRYFAGKTPIYNYVDNTKDGSIFLPQPNWIDPINQVNYCAPLNTLIFNASVSTNDIDLAGTAMTSINSGSTAAQLANIVGDGESITGNNYFIGRNGTNNNELCDAKTISSLGSVSGICPEGPTLLGSYLMPGMAHHARTNKIRTDLTVPADDQKSLKVSTYGIQLATNVPRIPIALLGETSPRVILQPAYRLFETGAQGGGQLVDMRIVNQNATATTASGLIYVNWEDSEQGGDYDQDVWGTLQYCLTTVANGCGSGTLANRVYVTSNVVAESTNNPQGFGYTISGTTQDGPHFHSGIEGFDFTDPTNITVSGGSTNASGGCNDCQVSNTPSTAIYTLSGSITASILQDPLYYAAKWGGFNDLNNNGIPDSATEWDILKADGTPGSDGLPDNYFYVSNPLGLETALNAAFLKILKDSSASAVATNSSTLNTGSRIFQGRFSSSFWSGQLLSYRIDPVTRTVASATTPPPGWDAADTPYPEWDAGQQIKSQVTTSSDTRVILTKGDSGGGESFEYASLGAGQKTALDQDWLFNLPADDCGPERVAYLRGHSVNEGVGTFTCASGSTIMRFRTRPVSPLGDIINANPAFVGPPKAGYTDVDHPGYSAFSASFKDRTPVVYVGANDGMLHGFEASIDNSLDPVTNEPKNIPTADAGKEVLAYVPTPVYSNLSRLTDSAYSGMHKYFVDGSPMVADACVSTTSSCSSSWKTVLVGTLGAGGKGLFALNVTNPKDSAKHSTATPLFSTANAASILLWEFTSADDADLGYTYNHAPVHQGNGQAKQIAKFQNGRWGVAVGNGYNSTSGKAALYVIFLSGPSGTGGVWQGNGVDYMKIVADVGPNNGLSTPVLFDANGDGLVDTAYAGDLKGKLWKFDLSNASPASWAMALGGTPLFSATDASNNAQPITTPPDVTIHPAGGRMVVFGTGKYLETTDNSSTGTQTLYGIRDQNAVVSSRADLTPQALSTVTIGGKTFRTLGAGCDDDPLTPEPACPATSKGWRIDLPTSGERATGSPKIEKGVVWFNTFIPSVTPCDFGGTGWLLAVNYVSGEMPNYKAFDTDKDGTIDGDDTIVAGEQIGAALGGSTLIEGSDLSVAVSSLTTGATEATTVDTGGLGGKGRITWREIIVQ